MTTLINIGNTVYSNPVMGGVGAASPYGDDFVFTVQTTGAFESFTIPCQNVGVFNAVVDWGDGGATSTITTYNDADLAHTYATADTYTIRVSGTFPNIYFNNGGDKLKLRSVIQLGSVGWTRLNNSFYGCSGMTSFTAAPCATSSVTLMGNMFRACLGMISPPDVSGFNTAAVTNMGSMFSACSNMTSPPDVSGFNTAAVTNMSAMFSNCSGMTSPPDVSGFNTAAVTTMESMFQSCSGMGTIGDIGQVGFNISSLTSATNMFLNVTMTTTAYDALLIAWEAQTEKTGVAFHAGGSTYTAGGAAATARGVLTGTSSWTITDGGSVP